MLVVLASAGDLPAQQLVERWRDRDARLMTVADLSTRGWSVPFHHLEDAVAVIGGQRVRTGQLRGFVTRLGAISEQELHHLEPEDRAYAASEMTAFLLAWLSRLPCPVVNRPSTQSLMGAGPSWTRERWMAVASAAGLRLRSARQAFPPRPGPTPAEDGPVGATVVGERVVEPVDAALAAQARALAAAAGLELLQVRFSGPEPEACFAGVQPWPDVGHPDVAAALLAHLDSKRSLS